MRILTLGLIAMVGWPTTCLAQTESIGPGGIRMAPGASQPHDFTPGGVGPGGAIAPGRAARDANMDRVGPGGTRLAPGSAGSVGTGPRLRTQTVAPSSGGIRGTIRSKGRHHFRPHRRRPPAVSRAGMR